MGTKRMRLRVLRADKDLTQSRLARRAGLNVTRYWQIENGEGLPPSKAEKAAIAQALETTPTAIAWPEHQVAAQAS